MPCPFARLAAFASPLDVAAAKLYHQQHNLYNNIDAGSSASSSSSSSSQPLSEYLKEATAKAHREVESSQGVRQLMGLASSSPSSSSSDLIFTRLDYVRWMIMLACIYAALEASLDVNNGTARRAPALAPLYASRAPSSPFKPLLAHLARYEVTVADIEAHLDVLQRTEANEEGAGLALHEMVDLLRDHGDEESDAVAELREAVAPFLARLSTSSTGLEDDHLRLLRPAQARSTANYVRRLAHIGGTDATEGQAPNLLLAHSYVRYLGDLSGGQHIRRRVEKIFPTYGDQTSSRGYDFYDFPSPSSSAASPASWHRELKDSFRDAMDAAPASVAGDDAKARARMMRMQGREASLAFELNKDLFEALVGNGPTTRLPVAGELVEEDDGDLSPTHAAAGTRPLPPSLGLKQLKFALSSPSKGHGPADLAAAAVLPLVCSALVVAVVARSVVAVATAGVVAA